MSLQEWLFYRNESEEEAFIIDKIALGLECTCRWCARAVCNM